MNKYLILFFLSGFVLSSCNKDGCIDPTALNYDPNAEAEDGSCVYLTQNLNFQFNSKLGTADFAFDTEALVNGRKVKFTRAQMYLSGFTFNGNSGEYALTNPYLLLKAGISDYNLGYLPVGDYSTFSFSAGVDSVSNHTDPASFASSSALSANNPDHMHWGWDPGYIFFVLEGMVDTTANMDGTANAPFIFHVGTDALRVDMAFAKQINSLADGTNIEMDVDWLKLLDGTNMTGDVATRSTHTTNNFSLAALMVSNVDGAFSVH
ncbi:MAG: hypothetical protein K9G46_12745 [Flavobacteriales bacterium]|jgi:hypothetical protein|nr:hypothetical protein [Flavobacteriales bacterium]